MDVLGGNLPRLAARAAAHYAETSPAWPERIEERVLHVHDGTTGRNTTVPGAQRDTIAQCRPLRLRYSTVNARGRQIEAAFLVEHARAAARLASILIDDLGVPKREVHIIREGPARFHVTAGGPFEGLGNEETGRLLAYLRPEGFAPPNGRATTRHQECYQNALEALVAKWRNLPPVSLEEHLRHHTHLADHGARIAELLAAGHLLDQAGSVPGLLPYLRSQAMTATFPPFDAAKTLGNRLVPVPGSIWLPPGLVAEAIPLEGAT
jgi:hypothetical protein